MFHSANHINLNFMSREAGEAAHVFNENAFPDPVHSSVGACRLRTAFLLFFVNTLLRELQDDRTRFEAQLREHVTPPLPAGPAPLLAYYEGLGMLAALYSALHALKSFLDVYAQLTASLISPGTTMTFSKSTVGGEKLSGGRLINWLRNSAPKHYANASALANLIESNSREWTTTAVIYRDSISHYGELTGMTLMQVQITGNTPPFDVNAIAPAKMPDGMTVATYFPELMANLGRLVRDSVVLLPGLDLSKTNPDNFLRVS